MLISVTRYFAGKPLDEEFAKMNSNIKNALGSILVSVTLAVSPYVFAKGGGGGGVQGSGHGGLDHSQSRPGYSNTQNGATQTGSSQGSGKNSQSGSKQYQYQHQDQNQNQNQNRNRSKQGVGNLNAPKPELTREK